jgi:hypothetical protein
MIGARVELQWGGKPTQLFLDQLSTGAIGGEALSWKNSMLVARAAAHSIRHIRTRTKVWRQWLFGDISSGLRVISIFVNGALVATKARSREVLMCISDGHQFSWRSSLLSFFDLMLLSLVIPPELPTERPSVGSGSFSLQMVVPFLGQLRATSIRDLGAKISRNTKRR